MIAALPVTVFVDRAAEVLAREGLLLSRDVRARHIPGSDVHWAEAVLHVRNEDLPAALKLVRQAAKKRYSATMKPFRRDVSIASAFGSRGSSILLTDASGAQDLVRRVAKLNLRGASAYIAPVLILDAALALWRSRKQA